MKTTQVLCRQNIGRLIRKNWLIKGNIKVIPTSSEQILKSLGHEVVDVKEFLNPPKKKEKLNFIGMYDKEPLKDQNHPAYKSEPCFLFKDNDVLIDGLEQAKALTNTVEIMEGLPSTVVENEQKLNLPNEIHTVLMKKIKLSCMFEATQEKMPKKKDPLRPSWVFKREYGIIDSKKNDLLCKNLAMICEMCVKNVKNKSVILDAFFSTPVEAHNKKIQFETTSELVITTRKKLNVIAEPSLTHGFDLPDLYPMNCTAGLSPNHFYVMQSIYPPVSNSEWPFIQTAILHYNHTQVKNIIEEEVTESQIQGRSLLKGFSIAAAEARAVFGNDVKELPEPVIIPVVQTDGKMFHFTIFQLNTLDLDNALIKNIFWNSHRIPLYDTCEYQAGRPILEGYNPNVIKRLVTFYNIE